MSEFRIDQITNQSGSRGPDIAGITTFTGTSGMVMPSGDTYGRFAKDFITDGIALYVDVSSKECYTQNTPNSIYDPVSGIRDDVFNGSPTFSPADSTGPDRLVFDGSSDGIIFDRCDPVIGISTGDQLTVSAWAKVNVEEDGGATIFSIQRCNSPSFQIWVDGGSGAFNPDAASDVTGRIVWRVGNGDQHVIDTRLNEGQIRNGVLKSGKPAPYIDSRGKWINIVGTYSGQYAELYINGEISDFNDAVISTWTPPTNPNSGSAIGIMNRWPCGNSGRTNGEFNHCAMYRRVLSSKEILHNYNILKGRFGL